MHDRKKRVCIFFAAVLFFLAVVVGFWLGRVQVSRDTEKKIPLAKPVQISVGTTPIEEYKIYFDIQSRTAASELQQLLYEACGKKLKLSWGEGGEKSISVKADGTEGIHIQNGRIEICGVDGDSCIKYVHIFANRYLGYAFAGETRQHILDTNDNRVLPENVKEYEKVWMEEREPIICLWKTNVARGTFPDLNVSLKSELMSYSNDQLYEYVKMMNYCGFTGIQVTDMCSTWAQYGGYEFVHDRIRYMADAAHSLGMNFTLWVWGAEFEGYGWVDHSVTYYDWQVSAYSRDIPEVVDTFDKYYSIYAQLADCSDRVIMHFNDPGKLQSSEDIGYFAAMLRDKCLAVNPELDFGINCYTYQIGLDEILEQLGNDITVYGGIIHEDSEYQACREFRNLAGGMGFRVGVWSWNLIEMEIDQLAEMNVNARLIADCYQRTSQVDDVYYPKYWSEMDSYHMINLFSLYCSGQLLQDPNQDPDKLLRSISKEVVGEEYSDALYEILSVIQAARTGNDWQEFRIGKENYLLESMNYPAEDILQRCEEFIPKLEEMIQADLDCSTVPLAISTKDLLSMILPQLVQIRDYAEFRVLLSELEEMYDKGIAVSAIQKKLNQKYRTVPEFNTVVGVWGQAEARAQYNLIKEFCEKAGLEVPEDPGFAYLRRQRLLGEMIIRQKTSQERQLFPKTVSPHWDVGFGSDTVIKLVEDMLEEGILTETEDGNVYLTDWENYQYDF